MTDPKSGKPPTDDIPILEDVIPVLDETVDLPAATGASKPAADAAVLPGFHPDEPPTVAELEELLFAEREQRRKDSPGGGTNTHKANPFLPPHILERLKNHPRNLVEELAQTGAALDASAAILRTKVRAERLSRGGSKADQVQVAGAARRDERERARLRQQLVDDLVDEYLPLIAAELRRRLQRLLGD